MSVPPALRELAEHSNAFTPLGLGEQRLEDPRFTIYLGRGRSSWSVVVQRLRLGDADVAAVVAEVRELLRRLDRPAATWEVSSSATPAGLGDRLLELGMAPFAEPLAIGMVLRAAPPRAPDGVEVRPVETLDDFRTSLRIAHAAFDAPADAAARDLERAERDWELLRASPAQVQYLARIDGEPVATGWATFTPHGAVLNAGSTLPAARGRGAYRALVAARFADAARRGTPALVTQAGAQSRPILLRLGFEEVAEIRILEDRGDPIA